MMEMSCSSEYQTPELMNPLASQNMASSELLPTEPTRRNPERMTLVAALNAAWGEYNYGIVSIHRLQKSDAGAHPNNLQLALEIDLFYVVSEGT